MKVKKCDVTVFKSIESTISKIIYEHEIPLLEQVFGEGNVQRYSRKELYVPEGKKYQVEKKDPVVYTVEDINYEEEYSRLQITYGMRDNSEISFVEYLYGRMEEEKLKDFCNKKYAGENLADNVSEVEQEEDSKEDMDYRSMTNQELRKLLNELGVKYPPNAPKVILVDLLNKADKGELEPAN